MTCKTWLICMVQVALIAACADAIMLRRDTTSAQSTYVSAVEHLAAGLNPEAITLFKDLKVKYPYSRYAVLADLRLADADYNDGKYIEAIELYRVFLRFHPYHDQAEWALFHLAEATYQQIPSNFWLLPPVAEKDSTSVAAAVTAFEQFLARYPQGKLATLAQARISDCMSKLAAHELYVARYYFQQKKYTAARWRAERIVNRFPAANTLDQALWILAQAHHFEGSDSSALIHVARLVRHYPNSRHHQEARIMLSRLQRQLPSSSVEMLEPVLPTQQTP